MIASWSLWPWVFGTLIFAHALTWWLLTKEHNPAATMIGLTSFVLYIVPAIAAGFRIFEWQTFNPGLALLLPVERKHYIRQLGMATALSQFRCRPA